MNCVINKEDMENVLIERHGKVIQSKIKKAIVGIAGIGGLGSNVALSLARIGIGKLVIVDFDRVELSNLNRQQYFVKHIGMRKVDALEEIIKECNPFVEIEKKHIFLDENNIQNTFKNVNIIVECFDNPNSKATITNTVLTRMKNKKIVVSSGVAGYYTGNIVLSKKLRDNLYFVGDGKNEIKRECGLMAPRVGIAANHQANTVLRIILGEE